MARKTIHPEKYFLPRDEAFPNNELPVLHYKHVLRLPPLFAAWWVKRLFYKNNWRNNWVSGIYTYHHYHSVAHEVMGVIKGSTTLQLGGPGGITVNISRGDVLVIPAGVAHKNLGNQNQVVCVGGYPNGRRYDMKYGKDKERPAADRIIAAVPIPTSDPLLGRGNGLANAWA